VSIDQGIGPVDVSGIWPVSPSRTTTYTLTARGQGGDEKKQSVTVKVVEVKVAEQNNQGGDMQCIENYKTAYQLKDINELVKAWPALGSDTKRKNALKDSFRQAQAIVLRDQCAAPSVSGDIAHYQCNETMIYTSEGRAQKPQTSAVEFVCRKTPTGWVVENHIVK
jgi:hypothetical protein